MVSTISFNEATLAKSSKPADINKEGAAALAQLAQLINNAVQAVHQIAAQAAADVKAANQNIQKLEQRLTRMEKDTDIDAVKAALDATAAGLRQEQAEKLAAIESQAKEDRKALTSDIAASTEKLTKMVADIDTALSKGLSTASDDLKAASAQLTQRIDASDRAQGAMKEELTQKSKDQDEKISEVSDNLTNMVQARVTELTETTNSSLDDQRKLSEEQLNRSVKNLEAYHTRTVEWTIPAPNQKALERMVQDGVGQPILLSSGTFACGGVTAWEAHAALRPAVIETASMTPELLWRADVLLALPTAANAARSADGSLESLDKVHLAAKVSVRTKHALAQDAARAANLAKLAGMKTRTTNTVSSNLGDEPLEKPAATNVVFSPGCELIVRVQLVDLSVVQPAAAHSAGLSEFQPDTEAPVALARAGALMQAGKLRSERSVLDAADMMQKEVQQMRLRSARKISWLIPQAGKYAPTNDTDGTSAPIALRSPSFPVGAVDNCTIVLYPHGYRTSKRGMVGCFVELPSGVHARMRLTIGGIDRQIDKNPEEAAGAVGRAAHCRWEQAYDGRRDCISVELEVSEMTQEMTKGDPEKGALKLVISPTTGSADMVRDVYGVSSPPKLSKKFNRSVPSLPMIGGPPAPRALMN